jgi:hypothetical protein
MPDQAAPKSFKESRPGSLTPVFFPFSYGKGRLKMGSAAPRAMVNQSGCATKVTSSKGPLDPPTAARRFLKSVRVTEFKGAFPSHRFCRPLFREVLLSYHVQGGIGWQLATRRGLLLL